MSNYQDCFQTPSRIPTPDKRVLALMNLINSKGDDLHLVHSRKAELPTLPSSQNSRTNLRHHTNSIPDVTLSRPTLRMNWLPRLVRTAPTSHLQVLPLTTTAPHRVSAMMIIARTPHCICRKSSARWCCDWKLTIALAHANACCSPGNPTVR